MPDKLQVLAPDPKIHGEALADMICKIFGNYSDRIAPTRAWLLGKSFYSLPHSRIGILNQQIVTHFGVFDYQMRIGAARLRTGGIGYVATHIDHRKKGYMEQTAKACIADMRAAGFDFTLLFGIHNFYRQFGYTRAWSEAEYSLPLADLPQPMPAKKISQYPFERRPELERLFNRYHARLTGTAVRPNYQTWNLRVKKQTGFVWKDAKNRPAGYLAFQDAGNRVDIIEAVGDSHAILAAAAAAAHQCVCDEIRFLTLHHQSPLAKHLRRGNVTEKILHHRNAYALAHLLNLPQTLQKLAPELSVRLQSAGLSDLTTSIALSDPRDSVTLAIHRGTVTLAPSQAKPAHTLKAGDEISQLLLGTDDPEETLHAHRMKFSPQSLPLLRALFPNQHPMLNSVDRY